MLQSVSYSLDVIREEVRQLVCKGIVDRQQSNFVLCQHSPVCEWNYVERKLVQDDFLLRDLTVDLLSREDWCED